MVAETIRKILESSKNSLVKSWETAWIPYREGFNRSPSIYFTSTTIRSKDPALDANVLSWNNARALLDQANFIKWDNDGTPAARNFSLNARFMFNGTKEDVKIFRRYLQENIMAFHPNVQVCKSKLQSYPYPENFGYMMYCANNIQVIHLISNFL